MFKKLHRLWCYKREKAKNISQLVKKAAQNAKNIRGLEKVYGGLVLYQGTLVSLVFCSSGKVFMVRWACSGHGDATWLYSLLSYTAA